MSDLKVVPILGEDHKPELGSLYNKLNGVIDEYVRAYPNTSLAEIVGILEMVKQDGLERAKEHYAEV